MTWLTGYWELWLIVAVPAVIEYIAIRQGKSTWRRPTFVVRTISSLMWKAIATYPHFTALFASFFAIVLPHFYVPPTGHEWTTPEGWAILVVSLVTIWLIHARHRAMQQSITTTQRLKEEPLWLKFGAGTGLVGIIVLLLNKFAGVEVDEKTVSAVFLFIGALVTAWQRRSVAPTAKIDRLEESGLIQTPEFEPKTVNEMLKNPTPTPAPFPTAADPLDRRR